MFYFKKFFSVFYLLHFFYFQGFRGNEIAQLTVNDIHLIEGIYCFHINIFEEGQRTKNNSSRRYVPIHPKLIEFRFLNLVREQILKKEKRIFSNMSYSESKGNYYKNFGQSFATLRKQFLSKEIYENKKILKDFHSLRYNFINKLLGRIEDDTLTNLCGHSNKSKAETFTTYNKQYQINILYEAIQQLEYKLNFSRLENALSKKWRKKIIELNV